MKIAIIGAGFTGLSAAYHLSKNGHDVSIFEKDEKPGGLAVGYKEKGWDWTLEHHYHHWFTNDKNVLRLAKELKHNVLSPRPKTSSFVKDEIYQLDSPTHVLQFPLLSFPERIRMGVALASLRYNPFWKPLENYKAEPYLKRAMGERTYQMLWEPLMVNKLGKYAKDVSLAWFWARVYKRTPHLSYPEGGFLSFAKHLEDTIKEQKGEFFYKTSVLNLSSNGMPSITFQKDGEKEEIQEFERVVVTLPSSMFSQIAPTLPESYLTTAKKRISLGAVNMIMRLSKKFLMDGTYWLSMCEIKSPILAVVEHTNYMNPKHYNNEHIVYVGNYMERTDPRFNMNEQELMKLYEPWLEKINPDFKKSLFDFKVFRAPFAQPIIFPRYSKNIPSFITPLSNVFLANIEQVYPWDRGTNYAVELGQKIAEIIINR